MFAGNLAPKIVHIRCIGEIGLVEVYVIKIAVSRCLFYISYEILFKVFSDVAYNYVDSS